MKIFKDNPYRGKLKSDNGTYKKGQWVFGDLVMISDGRKRIPHIYGCGEVYAESVGQSTGVKIEDKEIFDGDILENQTGVYIVFWDEKFLNWSTMNRKGKGCFALTTLLTDTKRPCKIIGNVIDNPEILKGDFENGRI